MSEWLYLGTSLASALAAVLAWAAKLWWGKEHIAAKNETIAAKESQIELLGREIEMYRELTPMKIREYFVSVRTQLEEQIDALKEELARKDQELRERESAELDDKERKQTVEDRAQLSLRTEDIERLMRVITETYDQRVDSIVASISTLPIAESTTDDGSLGPEDSPALRSEITPRRVRQGETYTTRVQFRGSVSNGFFDNYVEHRGSNFRTWNWDKETIKNPGKTTPGELNGDVDVDREYSHDTKNWPKGKYKIHVRLYSHRTPGQPGRFVVEEEVHDFEVV